MRKSLSWPGTGKRSTPHGRAVLGSLIDHYERTRHPLPPVSDLDMLQHFLESRGVTLTQAARGAGIAVSTLSSILAGNRKMNRTHLESLARYFRVAPAVFLGPATKLT